MPFLFIYHVVPLGRIMMYDHPHCSPRNLQCQMGPSLWLNLYFLWLTLFVLWSTNPYTSATRVDHNERFGGRQGSWKMICLNDFLRMSMRIVNYGLPTYAICGAGRSWVDHSQETGSSWRPSSIITRVIEAKGVTWIFSRKGLTSMTYCCCLCWLVGADLLLLLLLLLLFC